MNRNKLKTYAPEARREFIQTMTDRAAFFGLTAKAVEPAVVRGDVAVIAGRDHPRAVAEKRQKLEARIARDGFEQTMEAMAYTWFNRLVAIRFMELHGYLDHGYRVLSHPEGKPTPEILEHAEHVDLPGLKKDRVIDLKLDGNKEGDLYRLLLTAQCNALHKAMPFLFERIDDETELLLPANLLHSDSLIRKLVDGIDEDDWKEVEIIGWLYQFYISERKNEVIGKVVASADIPAATQLFTPNWIVKYLVQNTLGRQWLATHPTSSLRSQMEFYIEPAEQSSKVNEQLKVGASTRLNPEELTMLDPACGSCHILVEGYDLFKAIYLERGYRLRDIPSLILRKNLFGLELDDRAAQLGAFALMMKARSDDRRIFDYDIKPNVLAIQESKGIQVTAVVNALNAPIAGRELPRHHLFEEIDETDAPLLTKKRMETSALISKDDIAQLLALFENAKTLGSLIRIPTELASVLPKMESRLAETLNYGDLVHASAQALSPIVQQAILLAQQYDFVVANPPYMGTRFYDDVLKTFVDGAYEIGKSDLYAAFMLRNEAFTTPSGSVGMLTIPNWMFLSSFEELRKQLLSTSYISSFLHNGRGVFGSDFGSCAFVLVRAKLPGYRGSYKKLFEVQGSVASNEELAARFKIAAPYTPDQADFNRIPGAPIAYWASQAIIAAFEEGVPLAEVAKPRQGMATSDNDRFIRLWHEVDFARISFQSRSRADAKHSGSKWFPYNKGGEYRKWCGNYAAVINWENDGEEVLSYAAELYGSPTRTIKNLDWYFREGITWSRISSSLFGVRYLGPGFLFDANGSVLFPAEGDLNLLLAFLSSEVTFRLLALLNPSLSFQTGDVARLPVLLDRLQSKRSEIDAVVMEAIELARADWDEQETSWNFQRLIFLDGSTVSDGWNAYSRKAEARFERLRSIEESINLIVADAYRLRDEMPYEVASERVTLCRSERAEDIKRLVSYAVGCMMGRYGLTQEGLLCAGSHACSSTSPGRDEFGQDGDGIIPIFEADWGLSGDAASRFVEFVGSAWPAENLESNLQFVADSLSPKEKSEPRVAIRRYMATAFFKHHLSLYKRRPIYWLFSSGKERAFQCFVYLHRYNEGTLARMRTEYVLPHQGRVAARIEQIESEKAKATNTSLRRRLQKEQDQLKRVQEELKGFEEKLKHFADQKISIDLDDGVKTNYGKFGDLLAEVKAVTGGKDDE
ncbi:class I SAM-dependent DNA methyltransferase [Bradyrhizobium ottawaense]|uniref:BREX-1 system adenine-specific DNA-methyltransferase PglX n=1 Tax=Bradyrhizobium ottawaense TaxID=931866 RepID=UPI0012610B9F|nr:BREX-1 system adenine-specific DNA-methyltransferase PglX [Bradyrhizobium ottawaense]BBO04474.1 class I SAM-dependent DNA methyltransferase [Bradyrhizobium ottawaense]